MSTVAAHAGAQQVPDSASTAPAAQPGIRVTPTLRAALSWTDNLDFTVTDKITDTQLEVTPGLRIAGKSRRLATDVFYELRSYTYAKTEERNRIDHFLNARVRLDAVPERLGIDASGRIERLELSELTRTGSTFGDSNRREVRAFGLAPYVAGRFGADTSYRLTYAADHFSVESNALERTITQRVTGNAEHRFGARDTRVAADLLFEDIDYADREDARNTRVAANLLLPITRQWIFEARAGYEDLDIANTIQKTKGSDTLVGLRWRPSARTEFAAGVGHRFFGNTFIGSAKHTGRLLAVNITHDKTVASTPNQFSLPPLQDAATLIASGAFFPGTPAYERLLQITSLLNAIGSAYVPGQSVNFTTNRFFIETRSQATISAVGTRHTVTLSANRTVREALQVNLPVIDDFVFGEKIVSTGGGVSWSYKLTPQLALTSAYAYTRSRSNGGITELSNKTQSAVIAATTALSKRTDAAFSLEAQRREQELAIGRAEQNIARLTVNHRF